MTAAPPAASLGWQDVMAHVRDRIRARDWPPGALIPHEADLAREMGCARTTVNRALRELAATGLLERRRRAGTRVALHPVRKATLDIPVLRIEVEARGLPYRFSLLERRMEAPPPPVAARMGGAAVALLHLTGLHSAGGRPYAFEDRWIDTRAVPAAATADFSAISPNEWLVVNVPFEGGDIALSASAATGEEARALACDAGAPLFVTERTTFGAGGHISSVRLVFAPGYRMTTTL